MTIKTALIRSTPTVVPLLFLLVAYNRIWTNTSPPWISNEEELERLEAFYPDRYEDALESSKAFAYSAFEYPARLM